MQQTGEGMDHLGEKESQFAAEKNLKIEFQ